MPDPLCVCVASYVAKKNKRNVGKITIQQTVFLCTCGTLGFWHILVFFTGFTGGAFVKKIFQSMNFLFIHSSL